MLGDKISIRPLRSDDSISQLTALLHAAYRPLAERGMRYVASHQDEETTRRRCSKGETFVVEMDGEVVATVTLSTVENTQGTPWYDRPDVASFGQFAVRPDLQKSGIGSMLMDRVEGRARELGVREIALDTSEHADHLIRYYESRGYRFIEHVRWESVNYRSVIMSKVNVAIRQERPADFEATEALVAAAFEKAEHASGREGLLVRRLRHSISELSLVAELDGKLVGHILFSPISIEGFPSLALAPVSVLPEFQAKRIGAQLIRRGHELAASLGHRSVIVLGHSRYYPRFGYQRASFWGIHPPFQVPDEVFMARELVSGGLEGVSGTVRYPAEFEGV